jgi:hypothetical protein
LREHKKREIYLYNDEVFKFYVDFIKEHPLFIEEISVEKYNDKKNIKVIVKEKIVKKTTPSLDERGISFRDVMRRSQKLDNDEFYTRYEDIEKEIAMYDKIIWKDKCVFCNCDDAVGDNEKKTSAFALYFIKNFKELNLKKLICTHYGGGTDIFYQGKKGYVYTYIFTKNGFEGVKEYPKGYTESFDDPLSIKILNEEADIVCTNPPFSKAKEYWKIVIESRKKFLIISNITNAVTPIYTPYFRENKVWAGYNRIDYFFNPKKILVDAAGHWFTNLPIKDRPKYEHLKIMPLKKIPEKYIKYDDTKMLIADNCYIPSDYKKPFAVSTRPILNGLLEKGYKIVDENESYLPIVNGKKCFRRVLVQKI